MSAKISNEEYPSVSRFEVIDHTEAGGGRVLVRLGVRVTVSTQDDGLTMKVFLTDRDDVEAGEAAQEKQLGNDLERLNAQPS